MFHIYVIVATLAGTHIGIGQSAPTFDTKEACVAAVSDFVKKAEADLVGDGYKIVASKCATEDEFSKAKEDATTGEEVEKRLFGVQG